MSTTHDRTPGELRIYLGAAPGVGKTYAMLGEAHRRLGRGQDVVAAIVETHGRSQTAELLEGIEQLPRIAITYRGTVQYELDVDAVLRRRPELVLVDELAHTNTPGSRNQKRYQDVQELIAAGINVVSTVNIQHLEGLNDVVEQITGVLQRETVPDAVVRAADQIELVDITPEALQRRISLGNVYAADKADAALAHYFRRGNLTALRELALLWLADQVDAALAKYRADHRITATWEARERVVVAVTGGRESETLVRRAGRIAAKSSAELLVVHVVRGDGLTGVAAPQMAAVRELTAHLGAELHTVVGDDVPIALLDFARTVNATQLVLGTSRRSRWARMFDEGIGAEVVQRSGTIDVHMVTHEAAGRRRRRRRPRPRTRRTAAWVAAFVVPSAISALLASWLDRYLDLVSESALYFVAVLAVALFGGVLPAIAAALLAGLLLNVLFTDPRYSITIQEPNNFLPAVLLLVVAVAVAVLVDTAARRAEQAGQASREAELLTLFAGSVLRGTDLTALLDRLRQTYGQRAVTLRHHTDGVIAAVGDDPPERADTADTAVEVRDGDYWLLLGGPTLRARDRRVLEAVANQAVGLVLRQQLAEEANQAAALAEADRLRRDLLSAVSHDLRTPLAGVKAAISSLRSDDVEFSPEDRAELLATVEESADQLTSLVGNLLDSSRLAAGVVRPRLRPVYLDEVVHRALVSVGVSPRGARRGALDRVTVQVGPIAVQADPDLLERVLANLVDNALRYGAESPVKVDAATADGRVVVRVVDHGPGLPGTDPERVFDQFQQLGDRDNTSGLGLGLSVVRGFAVAMGGSVSAEPTPGGGLTVTVELADTTGNVGEDPLPTEVL
ncbi:sensor histidine kinase [Nocardia jinanensis]|uniref:histidine kinase n=1 Tax=Nocardia jinanensis TaxID=382504 RepID=A0A917RQT6_9NOCA|nr:sensor histidine kinase KdpD [Nocardia jinanensis]GGL19980.1 sensor protein KdpD [Nocardia jinanensis]